MWKTFCFNAKWKGCTQHCIWLIQWCGLRPRSSDKTGLRPKIVFGLGLAQYGVVLWNSLFTLVIIMTLKDIAASFQVLFIVYPFCTWNITTVDINSGIHLLKSKIRQVPLFTSGGLGLDMLVLVLVFVILDVVLVLRIWSCLHHWTNHIVTFCRWRWLADVVAQGKTLQHQRPRLRHIRRRVVCQLVQGWLVVFGVSFVQPQRTLPPRFTHFVRRWRRVEVLDRLSLLAQDQRDENQTRSRASLMRNS